MGVVQTADVLYKQKQIIMKKYEIKKAFSVLEKVLLIPGDEVYAEQKLMMMNIYSSKTRKLVGKVSIELFNNSVNHASTMKDCWINAEKQLPERSTEVLVCIDNYKVTTAKYGLKNSSCKKEDWFDLSDEMYDKTNKITSWQEIVADVTF